MKRIILIVVRILWILPYWLLFKVRKYKHIDKYPIEQRYGFIHDIVYTVNRKARVKVDCYGLENLPDKSGYFLAPNHQGLFDPLAIFETHARPIRAVVKKELTKTIIIKDIIAMLEFIPMDRKNIRESVKIIKYVSNGLSQGENFFVFPEGTRSRNKNNILEFKGGTFKMPINAKAPIIPVALIDCYQAFDNNTIKKLTTQIHYLKAIYYDEYQDLSSNDVAKLVHDRIEACIKEYDK